MVGRRLLPAIAVFVLAVLARVDAQPPTAARRKPDGGTGFIACSGAGLQACERGAKAPRHSYEMVRLKSDTTYQGAADAQQPAVRPRPDATYVTRTAILAAEDRRAPTPRDLAVIRAGLYNSDPQTQRIALRALGRLERPSLVPDIVPALKAALPEVRAEAANAIGQAAQGWKLVARPGVGIPTVDTVTSMLVARLDVESESIVRAAICETLGRLPYTSAEQVRRAEAALVHTALGESITDRLGIAQGLEALIRVSQTLSPPSAEAIAQLRALAAGTPEVRLKPDATSVSDATGVPDATSGSGPTPRPDRDLATGAPNPSHDARVRRLALEALIAAGAADDDVTTRAAVDSDAQVRRLAMRAASTSGHAADVLQKGLTDESAMVRLEALRGVGARSGESSNDACATSLAAAGDRDSHVALLALDELGRCGPTADAVSLLEHMVNDLSQAGSPRGWHRGAHALVALASAAPDRAAAALPQFLGSRVWQLRLYTARAALVLKERPTLETLANDADDNVREAAIEGLTTLAGHSADGLYLSGLARQGYQVIRAAASALAATPDPDAAVPALKEALQRLIKEGRDNSRDARSAIAATLEGLGTRVEAPRPARDTPVASPLDAEDLRRLASARARITIRDVGSFDLALLASEAPTTVVRFARLAESGYYNGLTFHRVVPNSVIQGGSPGANEYIGDASFMRDEVGLWPHVRGTVGISTRGHDTGDAQICVDLVDNPRFDHTYTVFAQLLNGTDIVDAILEGDVIERIEVLTQ